MKILVIGLGSMGKRRVRNLLALGQVDLAGFDPRHDRRQEAVEKYDLRTYADYKNALEEFKPDALVISTGPALHMSFAIPAAESGLHCFIEASVVDPAGIRRLAGIARKNGLVVAPSCTMRYNPGPRLIKQLIYDGCIGRPLSMNYHIGQYLPDWHPWESIGDFYVSQRETGGCREIVPFELAWINDIFGNPDPLFCHKAKCTDIDADIDDIYMMGLRYPQGLVASITVEVQSRPKATREMRIVGSEGLITFSGEANTVRHISVGDAAWSVTEFSQGTLEAGYINPEEPYILEIKNFLEALDAPGLRAFPNSLEDDAELLELLEACEKLSEVNQ